MAYYKARGRGSDSYNRLPIRGYEDSYAPSDDFLIVSGAWHDGLPCLTKEGTPGGAFK